MTGRQKVKMAAAAVALGISSSAMAQTAITYGTAGSTYTQNFDTLAFPTSTTALTLTWTDNLTLPGWYAARSPGGTAAPTTQYWATEGTTFSGALNSYGAINSTDRALGSLGSGTPRTQWYGVLFQNTTGSVLDKFTLSYTGEEWRQTSGGQNALDFYYSTNPTATGNGGTPLISDVNNTAPDPTIWTAVSALSFNAPKFGTGIVDGPIDGNAAENSAPVSGTVSVNGGWQPGAYLFLRWRDLDNSGSDQGLAIDNLSFSATVPVVVHNGTTLLANGSKTVSPAIDLGRVVAGNNTNLGNVTLSVTGGASTTYSDASNDGSVVVPATGTATSSGTTVGVRISGAAIPSSAIGSDITKTAQVKNEGETNDTTNAKIDVTAHVVGNRFVDNYQDDDLNGGSAAPLNVGKMLVGSSKTVQVKLTTVNQGDTSSNSLTTVTLPAATTVTDGPVGAATLADGNTYAKANLAAGTSGDVVYNDGSVSEVRDVTVTPLKSGEIVIGTNPGGVRSPGFLSVPLVQSDTAAGASGDARVYIRGDFFAPAAPTGPTTPVAPGDTFTLTNSAPTGDGTPGKRLAADVLGTSFDQSGWSASGLPALIGPARAQYVQGGTTFTAQVGTATGTVAFSPAGKINGTYGATLSIALQNDDQGQGVYGVAPNDLPAATVPVTATVSGNPAVQNGSYTLNGGTLSAPATNLTGSYNQSGGASTFTSLIGGGAVTVSGGSMALGTGAAPANVVGSLSVTGSGKLVLLDKHLAVNSGMTPATLRGLLSSGYAGGTWAGASGIELGAADPNGIVGIGYTTAAKKLGGAGTWFGASVPSTATLIAQTYFGDANLDGLVNGDDLALIDDGNAKGLAAGTAVWTDGDFNYDGVVNSADYVAIDRSLLLQGSPLAADALAAHDALFGGGYSASVLASVPEPTTLGLVACGTLLVAGRRRRAAK